MKVVVEWPDFRLGRDNPWPEAFADFSDAIAAHVGRLRDLVVADFSTTGPVERAASEVLLMDTFSPYFEYELRCGCGIPSIGLAGTPDDWRSVRRRATMLSELGLDDWLRVLHPVLDQIVESSEGRADPAFWRAFFRHQGGSGPEELTGWIHVLFPYLKGRGESGEAFVPNPYRSGWEDALRRTERRATERRTQRRGAGRRWLSFDSLEGPGIASLPPSLASTRVHLVDRERGEESDLRFVAGLFGVVQDAATMAVAPEFGWAVVHDD
jgi:hypothetical protein